MTTTAMSRQIQYGLLRMIDDEPGMTSAQMRAEYPGVQAEALKADLITLAEERLIAATRFNSEGPHSPLRYYTTPKGVMELRRFERESLPKPEQASGKDILAKFGIVLFVVCVLAYASCG